MPFKAQSGHSEPTSNVRLRSASYTMSWTLNCVITGLWVSSWRRSHGAW